MGSWVSPGRSNRLLDSANGAQYHSWSGPRRSSTRRHLHIEILGGKLSSPVLLTTNRELASRLSQLSSSRPRLPSLAIPDEERLPRYPAGVFRSVRLVTKTKLPAVDEVAMHQRGVRRIGTTRQGTYPLMRILTASRSRDPHSPTWREAGLSRSPRHGGVELTHGLELRDCSFCIAGRNRAENLLSGSRENTTPYT